MEAEVAMFGAEVPAVGAAVVVDGPLPNVAGVVVEVAGVDVVADVVPKRLGAADVVEAVDFSPPAPAVALDPPPMIPKRLEEGVGVWLVAPAPPKGFVDGAVVVADGDAALEVPLKRDVLGVAVVLPNRDKVVVVFVAGAAVVAGSTRDVRIARRKLCCEKYHLLL